MLFECENQEFSKIDLHYTLNHVNQNKFPISVLNLINQSVEKLVKNSCMVEFTTSEQFENCY